jgi:hypothetical protein
MSLVTCRWRLVSGKWYMFAGFSLSTGSWWLSAGHWWLATGKRNLLAIKTAQVSSHVIENEKGKM